MGIIAAAYARYSTSNQNETSIEAQLEKIRIYCNDHNLQLYQRPYIDVAFSGTNTDRPGFRALVEDAKRGVFSAVVVYDISRGSRDVGDWFAFRKAMQALGVRVYSCSGEIGDLDDPSDFLKELITVGLGQHMVLQTRQKSIDGQRIRASHGLFCGGVAPIGYSIENGRYVENPREADVVRLIFARYAAGYSYGDIISEIEQTGFRTRNGRRLERNSLHDILRNRRYTGRYAWFERVERHMRKHVGRPGENPVVIEDAIPRLVSDDLFERVQHIMDRKIKSKQSKNEYLLSGLIRCGECGAALTGSTVHSKGHAYPRYSCINKRKEHRCTLPNLKADVVDKVVADIIRNQILNRDLFDSIADKVLEKYAQRTTKVQSIQTELVAVTNKLSRLIDMATEYPVTPPAIKDKIVAADAQRAELEARLAVASSELPISREEIIATLEEDAAALDADFHHMREMVLRYISSVTVYNDRIDVVYTPLPIAQKEKQPPCGGCKQGGSPGRARTYNNSVNSRV